ncbi:branched-chain amino acid transport system II carrier protein [Mycoplasmatota bacterium]|nr:branched-chain amino acid transport system II carrier protein [Mycoplasmatota bacterium]
MKKLSRKDTLLIGIFLFSLFFGAGNLIFPPFLGQLAGGNTWIAMGAFSITAVGFPVLGVVAVAKSGGLEKLASRVNKKFALVFTILIYLSIGPFLGIPRAGSMPFEMVVAPYLGESVSSELALFLFTFIFFLVVYWLSLSPSKLVDRLGKVLTPSLLLLLFVMFFGAVFKPVVGYGSATEDYMSSPFIKGFLDGYLTMDTIAALNFGIVVALVIKSKGITDEKQVISTSVKAGLIAGFLLILIYSMLAHLGALSSNLFTDVENGAQTLTNITKYIFGDVGVIILALTFTLACLSTSTGLVTSCSQYFSQLSDKVSYKSWIRIITFLSFILANMGLTKILKVSEPLLIAIYPIAIMLILLSLLDKYLHNSKKVYSLTILFTSVVSSYEGLTKVGLKLDFLTNLFNKLPLYSDGLGWIIPALVGMGVGVLFDKFTKVSN